MENIKKIEPIIDISENVVGVVLNDLIDFTIDLDNGKVEVEPARPEPIHHPSVETKKYDGSMCYLLCLILYFNCFRKRGTLNTK